MGVDTKGILLTDTKDVFLVARTVRDALEEVAKPEPTLLPTVLRPKIEIGISESVEMLWAHFTEKSGKPRRLSIFFTCDCDNTRFGPRSLTLSLAANGNSIDVIGAVLAKLEEAISGSKGILIPSDSYEDKAYYLDGTLAIELNSEQGE